MFPIIKHLDDLRPHIADRKEINISTQPNGYHVVCYSISTPTTFTDPDEVKLSFLRECRGITFYPDGYIASRPFHKFFNVDERESTQLSNLDMSLSNVVRMMDKRDGSMLHPVKFLDANNIWKVVLKSKKSFESDVAVKGTEFLHLPENEKLLFFCWQVMRNGWTPIFEFTAPDNRIVLQYPETELKLLHVRHNVTGQYLGCHDANLTTSKSVKQIGDEFGLQYVDEYPLEQMQELIDGIPTAEKIEGYVIQFKNGDMVKWKTPWYLALHRTIVFLRERDIAEMILDEVIDDIKSAFKDDPVKLEKIAAIENVVLVDILEIQEIVEDLHRQSWGMERKDIALLWREHNYFSLLMALYSGKDPRYVSWYKTNVLKEKFSLEQI